MHTGNSIPDRWFVEVTEENRSVINDWKINQIYKLSLYDELNCKFVKEDGCGWSSGKPDMLLHDSYKSVEISFDFFKERIIKLSDKHNKDEDNNRLIEILKERGIK